MFMQLQFSQPFSAFLMVTIFPDIAHVKILNVPRPVL